MNNAELTDVLALTDALLEAGWRQYGAEGNYQDGYPTRHCLVGAVNVAAHEVARDPRQVEGVLDSILELLAAGIPVCNWCSGSRCQCTGGKVVIYNDTRGRRRSEVRALVQTAARLLTK